MTDISIIMPTFQNAKYIGRAIKSVLSQTYTEFELIIIDNYSQDKTQQIVESFKDSRIIYQKFSLKIIRSINNIIVIFKNFFKIFNI